MLFFKISNSYSINYISVEGEDKDNYEIPDGNFVYTITPQIVSIDLDNLGFEDTEYEYNGKNLYPVIDKNRLPSNVSVSVTYEGYGKDAKTYDVIARFSSNSNNYVINKSFTNLFSNYFFTQSYKDAKKFSEIFNLGVTFFIFILLFILKSSFSLFILSFLS